MKKIILLTIISSIVSLAGCKEEAKTTKWYRDHPDEKLFMINARKQGAHQKIVKTLMKLIGKYSS